MLFRSEAAANLLEGRAEGYRLDATDETEVQRVVAAVAAQRGRIDILVNNVGRSARIAAIDLPLDGWHEVIETGLTSAFLCARTVARHMLAQDRGGAMVQIASIMGISGG